MAGIYETSNHFLPQKRGQREGIDMIVKEEVEQVMDGTLDQAVYCYVPEALDLKKLLPESLWRYVDQARWFIGTIIWKRARLNNVRGKKISVRLNAKYLKRIMGKHYAKVIRALLKHRVVKRRPYTRGKCSFAYRLYDRYAGKRLTRIRLRKRFLVAHVRRWYAEREARLQRVLEPVHIALREQQLRLRVDIEQVEQILNTTTMNAFARQLQCLLLDKILHQDFYFRSDSTAESRTALRT